MAWYNPMSWGQRDAEEYDPYEREQYTGDLMDFDAIRKHQQEQDRKEREYRRQQSLEARTMGDPRHDYDVQGTTAEGVQADYAQANEARGQMQGLGTLLRDASQGLGPSGAGLSAQAQRDASLSQARALQAGRRGRAAVAGAAASQNAATMGVQQAAQNEAIGRANEMAAARGQYSGLLSSMRGQDIGMSQFDASQGQQANQFNARQQQEANLANQATQLGISVEELRARQEQERMRYGNLDPGSEGLGGQLLAAGTYLAGKKIGAKAYGGTVLPDNAPRTMAYGGGISGLMAQAANRFRQPMGAPQRQGMARGPVGSMAARYGSPKRRPVRPMAYGGAVEEDKLMPIGTRIMPRRQRSNWGEVAGMFLAGLVSGQAENERAKKKEEDRERDLQEQRDRNGGLTDAEVKSKKQMTELRMVQNKEFTQRELPGIRAGDRQRRNQAVMTGNEYVGTYAHGGDVEQGPQVAIVGEAGPELILGRGGNLLIDRPMAMTLGEHGRDDVVPLTDPGPELRKARHEMDGGMRTPHDLVGTLAAGVADLNERLSRVEGRKSKKSGGR